MVIVCSLVISEIPGLNYSIVTKVHFSIVSKCSTSVILLALNKELMLFPEKMPFRGLTCCVNGIKNLS